jgi:hypothetical protein
MNYVSHTVRWSSSGLPVQHTFTNVNDFLTFELDSPGVDVKRDGSHHVMTIL